MPATKKSASKKVARIRVLRPRRRLYEDADPPSPGLEGQPLASQSKAAGHPEVEPQLGSSVPIKVNRSRRRLYQPDLQAPDCSQPRSGADRDASSASYKARQAVALSIVSRYCLATAGVGLVPFPLLDMAALSVLQSRMLRSLSELYGIEYSSQRAKVYASSLLAAVLPGSFRWSFVSLVRAVPLIGPMAGALLMPAAAGGSTYALGRVFIQHFELGGTLLDFDPEKVRAYFEQQYRDGLDTSRQGAEGAAPEG